ncbi:MAG: hypothetical protein EXR63_05390 [Dehalococcoidia bacterium]|nr:hypothetical protein [Dehalococcoidia bacterium]MSQ36554.1 hypothetical protein [Dehalococcoidia bacterium]
MQQVRGWRLWAAVAVVGVALGVAGALAMRGGGDGGDASGAKAAAGGSTTGEAADAPALTSYRYTLAIEMSGGLAGPVTTGVASDKPLTFAIAGAVVDADREHSTVKANLGFVALDLETIQIGDRAWTREDGGAWEPQASLQPGVPALQIDPGARRSMGARWHASATGCAT